MNVLTAVSFAFALLSHQGPAPVPQGIWVNGYYTCWKQDFYPPSAIDFSPLTHIVYFSLVPTESGGVAPQGPSFTDESANAIREATHAAGRRILICVGGADSAPVYEKAIAEANRGKFIATLVQWTDAHGYDGIDIDMEPLEASDIPNFQAFIKELRPAMKRKNQAWQLTTATNLNESAAYTGLQSDFDQINIMTYDLSGTWEGYETWYNSCLYNGGRVFKSNGKPLPSVDAAVRLWESEGFKRSKLGIGVDFCGYVWQGATGPNQPITGVKVSDIEYNDLMNTLYKPDSYHWDAGPDSPYLSIDSPQKQFVSYDDARLCKEKMAYIRSSHLGGCVIWSLASNYFPAKPVGQRNPLLEAMRH
ncbi:MAG TPA: glycoside hydrolase family 18 protein [Fimbriimonadaceae bacterium]|jgi:chitinase